MKDGFRQFREHFDILLPRRGYSGKPWGQLTKRYANSPSVLARISWEYTPTRPGDRSPRSPIGPREQRQGGRSLGLNRLLIVAEGDRLPDQPTLRHRFWQFCANGLYRFASTHPSTESAESAESADCKADRGRSTPDQHQSSQTINLNHAVNYIYVYVYIHVAHCIARSAGSRAAEQLSKI